MAQNLSLVTKSIAYKWSALADESMRIQDCVFCFLEMKFITEQFEFSKIICVNSEKQVKKLAYANEEISLRK